MEMWEVASIFGIGLPEAEGEKTQRVSREEWPDLPDDYETLPHVVQRALYYEGRGPRPEMAAPDPQTLAAMTGAPAEFGQIEGGDPPSLP